MKILKIAAPVVSESLDAIFNASLQSGIFPDELKLAKVSPVLKSGDKKIEVITDRPLCHLSF